MRHAPAFSCDIRRAAGPPAEFVLGGDAAVVSQILEQPDARLDYLDAKMAFDALVDPHFDQGWVKTEVDGLAATAWELTRGDQRAALRGEVERER